MKNFLQLKALLMLAVWLAVSGILCAQQSGIRSLKLRTGEGVNVAAYTGAEGRKISLPQTIPLFSVEINDRLFTSAAVTSEAGTEAISFRLMDVVSGQVRFAADFSSGWKAQLVLRNDSPDTVKIANVVPFGASEDHLYITATGPWSLARSKLFRPGKGPVGVILPDNAWEMGYSALPAGNGRSLCAIARRTEWKEADRKRYWTLLAPGGSVTYDFYADEYRGDWQNGLRLMFQQRYLYDLLEFDNRMFEREDLKWIRHDYVIALQMAWDHDFYDPRQGGYRLSEYLEMGRRFFGGWDVYAIWPTWPTLGLDQRNQWDLYGDLPGGLEKLRSLADHARQQGAKFFIAYNPWDESTRTEDHLRGMARLIEKLDADGVVLDTRGSSSYEIQAAADSVKPGVVMYSEGMAVPKDMPGIVSGRVHDAIFMPPPLNLNKFIKPEFAIFRVCQLREGRIHREIAISFFNGYGTEMNTFGPGRPDWVEEEYTYLGRTTMLLRQNSRAFLSREWTPLIPTLADSIWVNKWPADQKTVYTVFSLRPQGYDAPLFGVSSAADSHLVDLWNHEEIIPDTVDGRLYAPVSVQAFDRAWLNTRREGNVGCIAQFPNLLQVRLERDSLFVTAERGEKIKLWVGMPSYQGISKDFPAGSHALKLYEQFDRYEGKFVIQLIDGPELLDERIVTVEPGTPRLISQVECTRPAKSAPEGMVEISAGSFTFQIPERWSFILYPDFTEPEPVSLKKYFIDKYPVTNAQFKQFLDETQYQPEDTVNFLKHWSKGTYPEGEGNYPVVYVSLEDAQAYAAWAGKRLPTEKEWQYAARGSDGRKWPWGSEFDSTRCNVGLGKPTPVDAYPDGASPFGVADLVGNVWQLTNDVYDNGTNYFIMIRGGSYYHPASSWWYVKGGPQPLDEQQMLLRVSSGFERNATVGFRCVKDAEQGGE